MDKKVKAKWIKALNSGEYIQGQNSLWQGPSHWQGPDDRFCCLGVLCDLYAREKGLSFDEVLGPDPLLYPEYETNTLPEKVRKWSKVRKDTCGNLAQLNDGGSNVSIISKKTVIATIPPSSFKQIAQYIKKRL